MIGLKELAAAEPRPPLDSRSDLPLEMLWRQKQRSVGQGQPALFRIGLL
jgi:hypothetical protein